MEFKIGGKTLKSRFFIGSGKLPTYAILPEMIEKSGVEVITVAVRRINPEAQQENILDFIPGHCVIMVNTSGATTAAEAVKIARIGRELTGSDWIKIEVETDAKYLLPDNEETLKAAQILVGRRVSGVSLHQPGSGDGQETGKGGGGGGDASGGADRDE